MSINLVSNPLIQWAACKCLNHLHVPSSQPDLPRFVCRIQSDSAISNLGLLTESLPWLQARAYRQLSGSSQSLPRMLLCCSHNRTICRGECPFNSSYSSSHCIAMAPAGINTSLPALPSSSADNFLSRVESPKPCREIARATLAFKNYVPCVDGIIRCDRCWQIPRSIWSQCYGSSHLCSRLNWFEAVGLNTLPDSLTRRI